MEVQDVVTWMLLKPTDQIAALKLTKCGIQLTENVRFLPVHVRVVVTSTVVMSWITSCTRLMKNSTMESMLPSHSTMRIGMPHSLNGGLPVLISISLHEKLRYLPALLRLGHDYIA
jgi:hypothetical protein